MDAILGIKMEYSLNDGCQLQSLFEDIDEERSGDLLLLHAFLAHRLEVWSYEVSKIVATTPFFH